MKENINMVSVAVAPFVMDLQSISLRPPIGDPEIATLTPEHGFFLNSLRYNDFRVRKVIFEKLIQAKSTLPVGLNFMIYETYRPKKFQEKLWAITYDKMKSANPGSTEQEIIALTETFTANPYDGIGSGHMAACAVDLTLCDDNGVELDMGTAMHEKGILTATMADGLTDEAIKNRAILKDSMEGAGLINYPPEWWHYSYGDHQWAWLTHKKEALYGPIDI